jgi:hypothetical protein
MTPPAHYDPLVDRMKTLMSARRLTEQADLVRQRAEAVLQRAELIIARTRVLGIGRRPWSATGKPEADVEE